MGTHAHSVDEDPPGVPGAHLDRAARLAGAAPADRPEGGALREHEHQAALVALGAARDVAVLGYAEAQSTERYARLSAEHLRAVVGGVDR